MRSPSPCFYYLRLTKSQYLSFSCTIYETGTLFFFQPVSIFLNRSSVLLFISLWIISTNFALFANLFIIHHFLSSIWAIKRLDNHHSKLWGMWLITCPVILTSYCSSKTFNPDSSARFLILSFHAQILFIYTSWAANLLYNLPWTSFLCLG